MGVVYGIISIKGGVGKTTTVVALGAALTSKFNKKVLLVDANFSAPNLGLHIGHANPPATIHDVMEGKIDPHDAVYSTDYGFDIMPGALLYGKVNPLKLKKKINELRNNYDIILIDSSPSLNQEILATMLASDRLFVVTTPDHVTLNTTLRAIKLAKDRKTRIDGLIINKVYNKGFELSLAQIEETADCSVLAVIPHETQILEALSKNMPSTAHKLTDSSVEFMKLAAAMIHEDFKDPRLLSMMKDLVCQKPKQELNRETFRGLHEGVSPKINN